MTSKARVIVASIPAFGHFEKMRAVAAGLVKKNYDVTFLTGTIYKSHVQAIGATFIPLKGSADFDVADFPDKYPEYAKLAPGLEKALFEQTKTLVGVIVDQHESVQELLAHTNRNGQSPVVLLHDTAFLGNIPTKLGAHGVLPKATIAIGITSLVCSSIDTGPFGWAMPPDSTEEGRGRNRSAQRQFEAVMQPVQTRFGQLLASIGVTKAIPFYFDAMVRLPDLYLQMAIPSLEYPRSDAPPGLRFIGVIPDTGLGNDRKLPEWWDRIVKHEKKLAVVTQGSLNLDMDDLTIPTLKALSALDVLVVATLVTMDNIPNFDVPANALVTRFVPFDELFKYTDVLVNNAGYGTVQQALYRGVPMVLAGRGEDKPETSARAAWAGAAIDLACQNPSPDQLKESVEEILTVPEYKIRAMELAKEYQGYDTIECIAAAIDEVSHRKT